MSKHFPNDYYDYYVWVFSSAGHMALNEASEILPFIGFIFSQVGGTKDIRS